MRNIIHRIARIARSQAATPTTYRPMIARSDVWRQV